MHSGRSNFTILDATPSDVRGIAHVNYTAWKETYQGLIEDDFLNDISVARYEERWHLILHDLKKDTFVQVACDDAGKIIGYCSGGKGRDPFQHYEGEIYSLYLLREFHGQGVGRELFKRGLARLQEMNFQSFFLYVLHNNPTIDFYRHYAPDFEQSALIKIGGNTYQDIGLGWNDFTKFFGT